MKKTILILVFALASFSMSANNEVVSEESVGCATYATKSANAEEKALGDMTVDEWIAAAQFYYELCEESGGAEHMIDPVFL